MEILKGHSIKSQRGRPCKYPFEQLKAGYFIRISMDNASTENVSTALSNWKKRNAPTWNTSVVTVDGFIHVYRNN